MKLFKIPEFLSIEECDVIYNRILETEEFVKSLGEDVHSGTADNSLTGRHWCHNYLYDDVIGNILLPKFRVVLGRKRYVQCWANTFRTGEGIAKHRHRDPTAPDSPPVDWTCTNLFIGGDPGLGTWFDGVKNEKKRGELMLFPSSLYHWVPPNKIDQVRISMAADVHYTRPPGYNENQYYNLT